MKKIVLVCSALFLIGLLSAAKIGISPSEIFFSGNINEKICRSITVYSDSSGSLLGNSRWNFIDTRDIKDYNIEDEELGIKLDYPNLIKINKNKTVEICLTAIMPGKYYGALIYYTETKYAGVGIWISADIKGEYKEDSRLMRISGNAVKSIDSQYLNNKISLGLLILSNLLLFIFFILLLIMKNNNSNHL